jgi:hypothetical protein
MGFLDKVTVGKKDNLVRLLVYGVNGVGKSTFAAAAPSPLFLDFDSRLDHLGVARLTPKSWDETREVINELCKGGHDYKYIVFDTLDHMEELIHKAVCEKHGKASIEDFDWGKGYTFVLAEWRRLCVGLDKLRAAGLNFILLAHDTVRTVVEPGSEAYESRVMKLRGNKGNVPSTLLCEKMDLVGYAHFDDIITVDKKARRTRMVSGDRILTFAHSPAYQTKQGIPFPDEIPLSWEAFDKALKESK